MTTPIKPTDTVLDLDVMFTRVNQAAKLRRDIAEAQAFIDDVDREIKDRLLAAKATVGTIRGVPIVTYRATAGARWAELVKNHAAVTDAYMVPVQGFELDKKKFAADHPALFAEYQSRVFNNVAP